MADSKIFALHAQVVTLLFCAIAIQGFFAFSNASSSHDVGIKSINAGNLTILFSLLAVVVFTAIIKNFRLSIPFKIYSLRVYFFYVSLCFISCILSENQIVSLGKLLFLLLEVLIICFLCHCFMTNQMTDQNKLELIETLWKRLVNLIYLLIVVILIAWLTAPAYQEGLYVTVTDRMSGGKWFMWGPNFLGQFSAIGILISSSRLLFCKQKFLNLVMLILSLYIFWECQSRTSIISLLLGIFVIFYYSKPVFKLTIFSGVSVLSFLGIFLYSDELLEFFMRGQDLEQLSSGTGRILMYVAATDLLFSDMKSLFFGQGFYFGSRVLIPDQLSKFSLSNLDNTYLEAALNSGIFAGISLIIFMSSVIWLAIKNTDDSFPSNIEAFLAVIAIFVRSISGPTFQQFGFDILILSIVILKFHFTQRFFERH